MHRIHPGWNENDLTMSAGAPAAVSGCCGYAFEAQGTQHVDYLGVDGCFHELEWDASGWHDSDLTNITGIPPILDGRWPGPVGYAFASQGTRHLDFVGQDNHIHELWLDNTGWHHNDLTSQANAPLAVIETPCAYPFDLQNTQHVHYVGSDGHVHELWWDGDGWHHQDLTLAANAPADAEPAVSSPTGYVFAAEQTQHVAYLGLDRCIHELAWKNGNWTYNNLSAAAGAPSSAGPPKGYVFDGGGTRHVNYIGGGHVHELWWDGNWHWDDLSNLTGTDGINGYLTAYSFDATGTRHAVCAGTTGRVHEFWRDADGWHHNDLTTAASSPLADPAPVSGYVFVSQGTQHVLYTDILHLHICELWWGSREKPFRTSRA